MAATDEQSSATAVDPLKYQAPRAITGKAGGGEMLTLKIPFKGDVDAAQQAGLHGILVRTGKFRISDLELGIVPYTILKSVAALPDWWRENGRGRTGSPD